ncbi:MAG: hypothetical protein Fur0037_25910 [Planctomycetota bacterium]
MSRLSSPRTALRARALASAAVCALAAAAAAQSPTVRTILSNGPTSNRYDIVILGDGYTAAEQSRFDSDCTTFLAALFQKEPYRTFGSFINVHTVFRPSLMSGANHPDANPPIIRNPVYGASYNTGGTPRCLYITNTSLALADAMLAPANEGRILVMVNDSRYGGCAAQFAVSYNGSSMSEVQIHEVGHSLGGLADEYDYPNGTYTGPEPGQVNITTSSVGQKWSHWWGFNGVSAFQGAGYYRYGLYRPKSNCLMRSLGQPLCPVCQEQLSRTLNSVVGTIESPQPAASQITLLQPAQQVFSFSNIVPPGNNSSIEWRVDGQPQTGQTGNSFTLDTGNLSLGRHTVDVTVRDLTPLVRQDPGGALTDTHQWRVDVTSATAAELSITSYTTVPIFSPEGGTVTLRTTVLNTGPAAAGSFEVEHFLSRDTAFDTSDIYLGGYTVPGLGVNQSSTDSRTVQLPMRAGAGLYILFAVVDRANRVVEVDENNNLGRYAQFVQGVTCTPTLEFRDDLLYPYDRASVPAAGGGTVLPTVIARCAAPGTAYVIAWGGSGTQPGTTVAPGVTVPLNADLLTSAGLGLVNGPIFAGFYGVLDAAGTGLAAVHWPAGLPVAAPLVTHFAAVLLDPSMSFAAATNAVEFTLR